MNGAEVQPKDAQVNSCWNQLNEWVARAGRSVPFVMGDLDSAHETERVTRPRRPDAHVCLLGYPLNDLWSSRFLKNDYVGGFLAYDGAYSAAMLW